ncbi:MAG TPA: SGNH/GDSL hydrolase family protein [Vicinamibacteria bacterium]|nr:SGNH/GDSL hydrolase family protein [Vicinamibacteria bacterium]
MRAERLADGALAGGAAAAAFAGYRTARLGLELWRHDADPTVVRPVLLVSTALAAAAVVLVASLRLRRSLRANLALALVSAALATYGVEAVLAFRPTLSHARFAEKVRQLDERRARGEDALPPIEPASFVRASGGSRPATLAPDGSEFLPLGGVANRLTVDCQEGEGEWLIYRTDEHGFHNPPGVWQRVPLQVAAVGDSFTLGSCVRSDENLVALVGRRFEPTLNLGMAGSGPLIMLALVREYLEPLRPQVVLWCHFGGNDLLDLRREMGHPLLVRYLEDGFTQGLVAHRTRLDAALAGYTERYVLPVLRARSRPRPSAGELLALKALRERLGLLLADPYGLAPTEDEERLFATILAKAKATVEGWGGRLAFVYLPPWSEPPRQLGEGEHVRLQQELRARVLKAAVGLDLQVIDVEAVFRRHPHPQELFACAGCHYGPEGYRMAAETVLAALEPAPSR